MGHYLSEMQDDRGDDPTVKAMYRAEARANALRRSMEAALLTMKPGSRAYGMIKQALDADDASRRSCR